MLPYYARIHEQGNDEHPPLAANRLGSTGENLFVGSSNPTGIRVGASGLKVGIQSSSRIP